MLLPLFIFPYTIQAQSSIRGALKGVVTDKEGQAVAGTIVQLEPDLHQVQTDDKGNFLFKNIIAGNYTLKTSHLAYHPFRTQVKIEATKQVSLSVQLEKNETSLETVVVKSTYHNADNFIDMTRTAMPSTVITRKEIEMMGSRRLDEVLKEQTGLAIINDIGSGNRAVGLQMQGFDSGYTMIMIDGQPMVGRNNGNFDLSRITVSNIERIEIIKGASSCLFGSEALAGVINIVTRKIITQPQAMAALRYGSFNMVDATLEGETPFADKKASAYLSANYYHTDGFNSNPYLDQGKTAPPFYSYALQGRGRYLLTENSTLNINGRLMTRHSENKYAYNGLSSNLDELNEYDFNGSVSLNNDFTNGTKLKTQYYLTRYKTDQNITDLANGTVIPGSTFDQYLHRAEIQAIHKIGQQLNLTGGMGGAYELLENTSYRGSKSMDNYFVYAQADWQTSERFSVVAGARFDFHNQYGSKINPSIGLQYQPLRNLTAKFAVGTGFKTPNFQQLYLVFTNVQSGYTALGAAEFWREITILKDAGLITSIFPIANQIGSLKPERSVSYSCKIDYAPIKSVKLDVNFFYNDMRNFINNEPVAVKTNGQQIWSYLNIAKAYTTGAELNIKWSAAKAITISAGYQLLYAIDRGVLDSIRNNTGLYGMVYDKEINRTRRSTVKDYFGMTNRSRHMANIKISYNHEKTGISGAFRVNYRSKYGFMEDNRANNFLDPWDTYVNSFFLLNLSIQKTFYNKHLQLQLTADNLMDYRDQLMPAQPGRTILAGISWRFYKN
ncbi:TonB-dependent receptor domain-containing protein [Flavobacterium procerum]|uniref:TonB-dependent receptor domain-containing protein n=2 Tax=Flavobacterium procerum TaxID=1455569 RepID=A0ABV6BS04_9FLAO